MHHIDIPTSPVTEIEARQDEVIRLLDELNQRIEWALLELGVVGSSQPLLPPVQSPRLADRP